MELTPHFLLDLEDEQARRHAEERLAKYYSEFVDEDMAEQGIVFDIDGNLVENGTATNGNQSRHREPFGGRNFKPGSPGWDPQQWGIDADDPDYEDYQTGQKLPTEYITVMTNYAKAVGRYRPVEDAEKVQLREVGNGDVKQYKEPTASFVPAYAMVKLRGTKRGQNIKSGVYNDSPNKHLHKYRANAHRAPDQNVGGEEEEEEERPQNPPKRLVTPEPQKWQPPPPRRQSLQHQQPIEENDNNKPVAPMVSPIVAAAAADQPDEVVMEVEESTPVHAAPPPPPEEEEEEVVEEEIVFDDYEEEEIVFEQQGEEKEEVSERAFSPAREQYQYHITDHEHDTPPTSNQLPQVFSPIEDLLPQPPLHDSDDEDNIVEPISEQQQQQQQQQQQFHQQEANSRSMIMPIVMNPEEEERDEVVAPAPAPAPASPSLDRAAMAAQARKRALYYSELAEDDENQGMMCDKQGNPDPTEKTEEKRGRWGSRARKRDRTPNRRRRRSASADRRKGTPDRGRSRSPNKRRTQSDRRRREPTPTRRIFNWLFGRRRRRSKMFDGINYKPGSNGWDPSDWGIDWTHQEYDSYLTGESLPPQYVSAMFNYAKLTNKAAPDDAKYLEAFLHNDLKKTMSAFLDVEETAEKEKQQQPRGIGQLNETPPPSKDELEFTYDVKSNDDLMMEPGFDEEQQYTATRRGSSVVSVGLTRHASSVAIGMTEDGSRPDVYAEGDEYVQVDYGEDDDYGGDMVDHVKEKQQQPKQFVASRRGSAIASSVKADGSGPDVYAEGDEYIQVDYGEDYDFDEAETRMEEAKQNVETAVDEEEIVEEEVVEEEVIEEELVEEEIVEEDVVEEEVIEEEIVFHNSTDGDKTASVEPSVDELQALLAAKRAELEKISSAASVTVQPQPAPATSKAAAPAPTTVLEAPVAKGPTPAARAWPLPSQQSKAPGLTVKVQPKRADPAPVRPQPAPSQNQTSSFRALTPAEQWKQRKSNGKMAAPEPATPDNKAITSPAPGENELQAKAADNETEAPEPVPTPPWMKDKKRDNTPGLKVWPPRKEEKKPQPHAKPNKPVPVAKPEFAKVNLRGSERGNSLRNMGEEPKKVSAPWMKKKAGTVPVASRAPDTQNDPKTSNPQKKESAPATTQAPDPTPQELVEEKKESPMPVKTPAPLNATPTAKTAPWAKKTATPAPPAEVTRPPSKPWGKKAQSESSSTPAAPAAPWMKKKDVAQPEPVTTEKPKSATSAPAADVARPPSKPWGKKAQAESSSTQAAPAAPWMKQKNVAAAPPASDPTEDPQSATPAPAAEVARPPPKPWGKKAQSESSSTPAAPTAPWMKKKKKDGAPAQPAPVTTEKPKSATPARAAEVSRPPSKPWGKKTQPESSSKSAAPAAPWMKKKDASPAQPAPTPVAAQKATGKPQPAPAAPKPTSNEAPWVTKKLKTSTDRPAPQRKAPDRTLCKSFEGSVTPFDAYHLPRGGKRGEEEPEKPQVNPSTQPPTSAASQPKKVAGVAPWANKSGAPVKSSPPPNGLSRVTPENNKPEPQKKPSWVKNGVASSATLKEPTRTWPPPATNEQAEEDVTEVEIIDDDDEEEEEEYIEEEVIDPSSEFIEEEVSDSEIIEEVIDDSEVYEEEVIEEVISPNQITA